MMTDTPTNRALYYNNSTVTSPKTAVDGNTNITTATARNTVTTVEEGKSNKIFVIIRYSNVSKTDKVLIEPKCYSSKELTITDAKHFANYAIRSTAGYTLKRRDYLDLIYKVQGVSLDSLCNKSIFDLHQQNIVEMDRLKD